jgi:hypothetical protein
MCTSLDEYGELGKPPEEVLSSLHALRAYEKHKCISPTFGHHETAEQRAKDRQVA